ncbi:unnamed protein product [Adineta ricciae]|uniref:Uncharacterized protein n=1 Tax=Adineta ricciae TaxID=249248 RepID=A0A815WZJ2_ADIRI|nr:unnamed protein product [Adineta ricciae]CAF1594781.1 unnamed protein product [Adineta ricciae]
MAAIVTSIFGDLCVIFRLLSSLFIKFYRRITRIRTETEQPEENRARTSIRLLQTFRLLKEKVLTLDLFESDNIHLSIISTRVYISLLLIGAITFSIYTSLAIDMYTITIRSPTLTQYENAEVFNNQLFPASSASALFTPQNNQTVAFSPTTENNNYSCSITSQCSGQRGFYPMWKLGMPVNAEVSAQLVPGFVGACFPVEAGLLSSLECIYNPSCLALLIAWRSFNMTDII